MASDTVIDEIADGVYRVHTPFEAPALPGGFSFNQYLVMDDQPLLFHCGLRGIFPRVKAAVERVVPAKKIAFFAVSHFEADECGALNAWLEAAPGATAVCSEVGAMVSLGDYADRAPRGLADGERLTLGARTLTWLDAPHLPHGWDCGYRFDAHSATLLCGDLFTQPGSGSEALVEGDLLGPSEAFRKPMDYYAHAPDTRALLAKLGETRPTTLACMHGSAWRGDGAALLAALADALEGGT